MPKRHNESSLEFLANKLRKLEKQVKRSRRKKRVLPEQRHSLASSSSRSSSPSTSSSSSCSSRAPSPNPEYPNSQPTNATVHVDANDVELPALQNEETIGITLPENPPGSTSTPGGADPIASSVSNSTENITAGAELLDILGADPSITQEYGPVINKDVATRFAHIATSGLDKEIRKDLLKKYLVPANCINIAAPQLNAEIKAALPEQVVKRDKAIETRQMQMAAGISSLGKIISEQLSVKDKNNDLIKDLMEVGRIFCDIQHSESETRRQFALYTVKKDLKDQLSNTKIDKFLFGNDFSETLKTAKAVSKSSSDLKPDATKKPKPSTSASTSSKNLNWKARATARRQPMAPQSRYQPPAPQNAAPRKTSSHNYTQRSKQTRRR